MLGRADAIRRHGDHALEFLFGNAPEVRAAEHPSAQREILAAAEDFLLKLADAATFAKFQAYSIDATFVTELQADVALITGKKGQQTDDRIGDSGGTAETAGQIRKARQLIKALNTSVRNKFRNDPVVLAK